MSSGGKKDKTGSMTSSSPPERFESSMVLPLATLLERKALKARGKNEK
jgi:hypothetical protein